MFMKGHMSPYACPHRAIVFLSTIVLIQIRSQSQHNAEPELLLAEEFSLLDLTGDKTIYVMKAGTLRMLRP